MSTSGINPIPDCQLTWVFGLLETLDDRGGRDDGYKIARDLQFNFSDLLKVMKAAEILGVEHSWLGFVDSGLPKGDPPPPLPEDCFAVTPLEVSTEALVRVVRDFRPHVMTTYDENGGYPHPDHIRCHQVSVAAYEAAGAPSPKMASEPAT